VSFVLNEGEDAFLSSVLRLLNADDYESVPAQLLRWTKETISGRLVENVGLANRRRAELAVWNQ
jgi:lysozyme